MLEGAGSLGLELTQELVARVAELGETGVGDEVEDILEQEHQLVSQYGQDRTQEQECQRERDIAAYGVYEAETEISDGQRKEDDQASDELLPSLVEIAEGEDGHEASEQEHHEEHHPVMREDQQGEQGDDVKGQDSLVTEECLVPEGRQGERDEEKVQRLGTPHKQGAHGEDQEDQKDVQHLVGLLEDLAVREVDCKIQDEDQYQREQDVACPLHRPGCAVAHICLVLDLVGVEHLSYLGSDDLAVRDYKLTRVHETLGGRDGRACLGVDDLRRLSVVDEVRNYEVVDGIGLEDGVEIVALVGAAELRDELGLGVGLLVHLGDGHLGRPLVLLDIEDLPGEVRGILVHLDALVRDDALGVDVADGGDDGRLEGGVPAKGKRLRGAEVLVDDILGILVVRDDAGSRPGPFLLDLLLRLEDREVELGVKRLVVPLRTSLVLIAELRAGRKDQDEDDEKGYEREPDLNGGR